ncbi:NAD-dependent epimerase/dehydratase family protein [Shewanella xiamenensis]|uniref:NAD-dependent epimerase/dehydratase family protein n=1 Tax=Shewanella xiamenensis TaxID=332186 RepID=UPI001CC3BD5F|nr:NAD-dependent epimerase/dehydratase family protein [Shewanella xiamenensis]BDA59932.1 epimerase [Shewanella xiamenensis]
MSIFLTGATGFIGKTLSNLLNERCRYAVRENGSGKFDNEFIVKSIDNNTNWKDAFQGCDSVIHLAGLAHSNVYTSKDFTTVNVEGTRNLAYQAAKAGVKRFVFVSSIGVNGLSTLDKPFSSFSVPNPHNIYAKSKLDAELALYEVSKETGLEVVVVRPTMVYGAHAPGNFGLLTRVIKKSPCLPFDLTDNKRDFIAVQNLADLLITCANHPDAGGHIFLASDGETVSIKEFTNAVAKGLNKKLIQLPVPVGLLRFAAGLVGKSAMAEQLLGNLQVDSSNAKEVLGWTPPYTMEQAMASLSENKK